MVLPGGVLREGVRRRDFAFRPVDGILEAALVEAADAATVPEAVTAALIASLAELGEAPAVEQVVWDLAVGDRQFLARQLAIHLGHDPWWCTTLCGACEDPFDVEVWQADLPVKAGGESFPFAEVERTRLRVPSGADQEAVAQLPDDQATTALLARCQVDGGTVEGEADDADVVDVDPGILEEALEAAAPEVALAVLARCPLCDAENELAVDPYATVLAPDDGVFDDIHRLASGYHWSEADILALTRARRQRYLRLLEAAGGDGW
jgi:hypothetical protein